MWFKRNKEKKPKRKWMTVYKEGARGSVKSLFCSYPTSGVLTIKVKEKKDGSYRGNAFFTTGSGDQYPITLEFVFYHFSDAKPVMEKYNLFNFDIV